MANADFDPANTFASLDVPSYSTICSPKVRYEGTSEAILALIRIEKRQGNLVKQMPYRCKKCKGVHNTHLISREALAKLVVKYQKREKNRNNINSQKSNRNSDKAKNTKTQLNSWKNYNLIKLLDDLQKVAHEFVSKNSSLSSVRMSNFSEHLSAIQSSSSKEITLNALETKILWILFYLQRYKEFLQIQIEPTVIISSCLFTIRDGGQDVIRNRLDNFEQQVITKYFSVHSLFDGLRFIAEKCAGINGYDWKRINILAKDISEKSEEDLLPEAHFLGELRIEPGITKANIKVESNRYFDKAVAQFTLAVDQVPLEWNNSFVTLKKLSETNFLHTIELIELNPSTDYLVKISLIDVRGRTIDLLEKFRTGRLPDQQRRLPSDSGRNSWPTQALPPGGGAMRRRG